MPMRPITDPLVGPADLLASIDMMSDQIDAGLPDAFRMNGDMDGIITREQLVRINEVDLFPGAPGRTFTEQRLLPVVRRFFRSHVKRYGWFYPTLDDAVHDALAQVRAHQFDASSDRVSSLGHAGSRYLKALFKSFWDVDGGPSKRFWDDRKLDGVLRYRLGLNTSRPYTYELHDGTSVTCRETFDINIKNVRYGFIVQRSSVSWFKPTAAYEVYRRFLGAVRSPVVWDPSCGFGARLLGFAAAYPEGRYIGTDPATQTFRDLLRLAAELRLQQGTMGIDMRCHGSEVGLAGIDDCSVDLVFTSPPYFDKEKYFDEPTQCWNVFGTHDAWTEGYMLPTFKEAFRVLRQGAPMVINIDDKHTYIVIEAAERAGFKRAPDDDLRLSIGRDHFVKHTQGDAALKGKFEPILVFRK